MFRLVGLVLSLVLSLPAASAAELEIASCVARSAKVYKLHIQLLVDAQGRFVGRYKLGSDPVVQPSWVNAGEVQTPPAALPRLLAQVNRFRDTGLDANRIQKFQNVFIDGDGDWDIELWKLMDASGRAVGWMAYAFGAPLGCYPD